MEKLIETIEEINVDPTKVRFSGASWFKAGPQIIVVGGAGTISSWVSLPLSRIGHEVHIVDFDNIEIHNLAGQLYGPSDVGSSKVSALKTIIERLSTDTIFPHEEKITEKSIFLACPIMISGFDNMEARKNFYEVWKTLDNRELLIDGRLTAECGQIFTVKKGQEDEYEKYLYDDSEIEELPCSFKSTSHCGMFIASTIVSILNNYLSNKIKDMDIREVPFKTEFDLTSLTLNI